ncbi:hypothetical protein VOLCADRAFT_119226 [Volvox carteri f. nagariensis]|uniref:Uncharacterized protein n=1 Tax=Volvox carteri f. nagariensis TaxID=3068 RepID=D8UBK2_VOLCA|nr:uncharacterized protein VOLCADRAFT_119226 [Volvox carteri f. nagariensis]EFJ42958.1 hypothetical protein VOLCADRAFT_119226 [Volvox carteri f. nagariensis]|eukprot:XP_002955998.1 hypothetical protein VOLCADRAFT_119226 [Volvox carteri f. nagariensis]
MDNISTLGLDDAANGFAVFDEPYRERASSELSGLPSHTIIFSYGPPDMVRQAKLEALEMKVRRKMQEQKASVRDTHALSDFTAADMPSTAVRVSARANGVGSLGLVKSLVVPPELTEHGEEVRGSSHFILDGERLEYQRPARIARSGSQVARPMPQYRMYEPGQRTSVSGNQKKKQQPQQQLQQQQQQKSLGGRGAAAAAATESAGMTRPTGKAAAAAAAAAGGGAAAAAAGQRRSSLTGPHLAGQGPAAASASASGGGGGSGGVSGGWVGGAEARAHSLRSELKVQLSDGMLAYVPSKFERPKNVERTAFVPQGQVRSP